MHKVSPVIGRTTRSNRQGVWTQGQAHMFTSAFCCYAVSNVESCETANGFVCEDPPKPYYAKATYLGSSRPSGLAEPVLHEVDSLQKGLLYDLL